MKQLFMWLICLLSVFSLYKPLYINGQYISISEEGTWGKGRFYYYDVVVRGDYAYTVTSDGLEIIDVSDPANPVFTSLFRLPGSTSWFRAIAVKDNYAYITGTRKLLQVMDISDPYNPEPTAFVHGNYANGTKITVSGGHAYVADLDTGLRIIDISNPKKPFITSTYKIGRYYQITGMHIRNNLAILSFTYDDDNFADERVRILDISNPYAPVERGGFEKDHHFGSMAFVGDYAYTQVGPTVTVYDFSRPAHPKKVGRVETKGWPWRIRKRGDYIYAIATEPFRRDGYIHVIGTADPRNPEILYTLEFGKRYPNTRTLSAFYFKKQRMFLLENQSMHVLNVSDPLDIQMVTSYANPRRADVRHIQVKGNHAYILDALTGFGVLDISDPANPFSVFSENTKPYINWSSRLLVEGDYLYEKKSEVFIVHDISNPAAPQEISRFVDEYPYFRNFDIHGNYAYFVHFKGFKIINMSDLRNWKKEAEVPIEEMRCLHVFGNHAYVSSKRELKIMDLANPADPVLIASTPKLSDKYHIIKKGNYLFAAKWNGISALDISDPANPGPYAFLHIYGDDEFTISGDYLIMSYRDNLVVVDIGDPMNMKVVCKYPKPADFQYIHSGIESGYPGERYFYSGGNFHVFRINQAAHAPQMKVTPGKLLFTRDAAGNTTGAQSFKIKNPGQAHSPLNWKIESDKKWLGCSRYSGRGSQEVMVSADSTRLSPGDYHAVITVKDMMSQIPSQQVEVTLTVHEGNQGILPFGELDSPGEGEQVSGSIAVTGWALDNFGVTKLEIFREDASGALVYIGDAVFIPGARPDVAAAYPDFPNNDSAGWGYMMLTHKLPNQGNGPVTLHAIASDLEGNSATLGIRTIIVDNKNAVKPFGAIDTPEQGAVVSGNKYLNWGWALTPQPNMIPFDGSSIDVWVDGVNLGHPVYNVYRKDIAALFPGYANSEGAVGYFYLDAEAFSEGLHTIQWTVKDSAGNVDGIGSRYFTISHAETSDSARAAARQPLNNTPGPVSTYPIDRTTPAGVRIGYDREAGLQWLSPGTDGATHIEVAALSRLEIHLPPGTESLLPLPTGASLDENGTFSWQIGAGFGGLHKLIFLVNNPNDADGKPKRKEITVNIH
jgi:hypothetical protein